MATPRMTSPFRADGRLRSSADAPDPRTNMQTGRQWGGDGRFKRLQRRGIARMLGMTGLLTSMLFIRSIVIPI